VCYNKPMNLNKNISKNIRKLTSDNRRLAKRAGIPLSTLYKVVYCQKKDIQLSTLYKISQALKISIDQLIR